MAPKYHREPSEHELPEVPTTKAYRNNAFLNSSHARHIRSEHATRFLVLPTLFFAPAR